MDLLNLITKDEGQTTEFKKSLSLKREAFEALCSMVNAESAKGIVIFGVDPNRNICGIEPGNLDKAQRSLSQSIRESFDPPLSFEINIIDHNDKKVLIVSAQRHKSIPYHEFDGRAWIRQGSDKKSLTISEKEQLRKSRDRASYSGPWQCDRCKAWVGHLSSYTITNNGTLQNYNCDCGGEFWPIS